MRSIQALGITLLALAVLWLVVDQVPMFQVGPGYNGPTISQDIGQGVKLLLGGSPQGVTIGGAQLFLLGLIGSTGIVGIILLGCGGIVCLSQSFLRGLISRSQALN